MSDRAGKFTVETKKIEYYSDFYPNLDKNPMTGYLGRVTNEESVKQSLKSLILTQRTERPFQPWIGSKLYGLLFEPMSPETNLMIEEEIRLTIENCEPRVILESVMVTDGDDNAYNVNITFSIASIQSENYTLDVMLRRTR